MNNYIHNYTQYHNIKVSSFVNCCMHDRNAFFQWPNPSVNMIKTNTKNPWRELKTVKRIWNVSLRPETETVRTKNSQVRPKRNSTPLMLNDMRRICLLVTVCFILFAVSLVCRMTTTITQMKKITLTTIMIKMGARNAPTRAPICDRKQLQMFYVIKVTGMIVVNKFLYCILIHSLINCLQIDQNL